MNNSPRSDFLQNEGDCLSFRSRDDFTTILASLDLTVPPRDLGRKSFHRERYCAIHYLQSFVEHNPNEFPFSICKSECPDFQITLKGGTTIGLEHTDVSTEEWQKNLTYLGKKIRESGGMLYDPGPGLPESEALEEWAKLALVAIADKIAKLNKSHYKEADTYELLLYSNTNLPNVEEDKAIQRLSEAFNQKFQSQTFERLYESVSVMYGRDVWFRRLVLRNAS